MMISLEQKSDCCGCWACVQCCPKQCISMHEDDEGFLYPAVDTEICIHCGLCERVCPIINQSTPRKPIHVYAAKNRDNTIRMSSSSGGIFTSLAETTIAEGGVVFGAKFDRAWNVIHGYTETADGISDFRGSKYVQSIIGSCYLQAEEFLKAGRRVLFTGTPCQIAGLNKYLMCEYPNLLTADVVCHGVPSPMVWRDYLYDLIRPEGVIGKNAILSPPCSMPEITNIRFRDKRLGWQKFGFEMQVADAGTMGNSRGKGAITFYEPMANNPFMRGFLMNLYLRPSCHACPSRQGKSGSDITIADYWGIRKWLPEFDDDKGVSLVTLNTQKAVDIYQTLHVESIETTYNQALEGNYCMEHSLPIPKYRTLFWQQYKKFGFTAVPNTLHRLRPSLIRRMLSLAKRIVKRIIQ